MEKFLKFLTRYWFIIAACATITSTGISIVFHLKGLIDKNVSTITQLNSWVSQHDDSINDLQQDVTKLKEDERLREQGICK